LTEELLGFILWTAISVEKRGGKMSSVFRPLATITAWILFILGLLALLGGIVVSIVPSTGALDMSKPLLAWAHFGYGTVNLALSVVVMKLRPMSE
jgi:hypothetical protein